MLDVFTTKALKPIPIWLIDSQSVKDWLGDQTATMRAWAEASDFSGQDGRILQFPDSDGKIAGVALGLGKNTGHPPFPVAALPPTLASGDYVVEQTLGEPANLIALAWALGHYRYDRYKEKTENRASPRLVLPPDCDGMEVSRIARAVFLVRDLVNTPANDMGPADLETAAGTLCADHGAQIKVIRGDDLITQGFPLVHAVGRAAARPPLLIDMTWGDKDAPKVTLIGKGVCFDSGGLNLKPGSSMSLMKKDMGGAAHVLGLAQMIMTAKLALRLRVIVPAVENAVAGNAFRPGDILPSRKGLSVEIGNTDAEGRLILADALTFAAQDEPELVVDMATLTGAARTALGPDIPPFYTNDDQLAQDLMYHAYEVRDPLWQMPLWPGYADWLSSKVADINHISEGSMAGSITAALFLQRFAEKLPQWLHIDIHAWNLKPRPGQPIGGEAQCVRALYELLKSRYGKA